MARISRINKTKSALKYGFSFRATFAPLKSVLSGKSVVYSVFVFSLRYILKRRGKNAKI